MKMSIKSLIAIVLTTLTISTAAVASDVTVLSEVKNFNKINVSGNVEVILVQSNEEKVQVYNDYYKNNALVQSKNGVLNISSYEKERLTVVVTFKNIEKLTASDNAIVNSYNALSALGLEVNLKHQAVANLNLNTINLNTQVTGTSNLILEGSTLSHQANIFNVASVNLNKFTADNTSFATKNTRVAKTNNDGEFNNLGK
ncbi:GIN domain-containing protein [Pedobacter flavus]|uniref:DUF2807 domain-containing protein n=1 Tax=Pedobacter flavus TaxID=3113906 RepID=A0ABU7H229_9SPHI|nr:DUF2807 domain-containing protein [Pedobacter sp. VNH31]MEE1885373.1 DUF2807 domain-containing protein [Pedobacter sp. VNH31]